MENLIVGLIVAGAVGFVLKSFINTYRGEGDCGCGSSCGGCQGHDGNGGCDPDKIFPVK